MTKLFRCNRYCLRLNYIECWKSSDLIWSNLVLFNQIWSDFICLCHSILLTLIWNPVIHSYQIQFCLPFFILSHQILSSHIFSHLFLNHGLWLYQNLTVVISSHLIKSTFFQSYLIQYHLISCNLALNLVI